MMERKIALSIEEAADYTGIGRNTLRKLVEWKYEQLEKAREAVENPKNFAESNIYYLC